MKNLECLVLLSIWTYASDSVNGIRVPSAWNEIQEQKNFKNFDGRIHLNNRFNVANRGQVLNDRFLQRRTENKLANGIPGTLYHALQNSALHDFFTYQPQTMSFEAKKDIPPLKNLIHPQNTNLENHNTHYKRSDIELPPLKKPKYTKKQVQHDELLAHLQSIPALVTKNQFPKYQKTPLKTMHNEASDKYPRDIVRVGSSSVGNTFVFMQQDQTQLGQPFLYQFTQEYEPLVREENTQAPSARFNTQSNLPPTPLRRRVSQNLKFIVSASEEEVTTSTMKYRLNSINPLTEPTTRKEPIFFVTEGYRNVLVQGPNKKKKYQGPKYQDVGESRKVLRTNTLERGDFENKNYSESDKPSTKRRVTKIYKIHNNEDRPNNAGSSNINLLGFGRENPRRYFERPQLYTEDGRKSSLQNRLINNYRDDQLYEPLNDNDSEKEIEDNERIKKDDRITTEELEEKDGNEQDDKTDDTEEDTNEETFNLNKHKSKYAKSNQNEQDKQKNDSEEETENEEEQQQEAPYSEHADPEPLPTKPIYPGEGAWAKPGPKHRPYVSHHRFLKPEDDEQKPDGYDVFEELEQYFDSQKNRAAFGIKTGPTKNPASKVSTVNKDPTINPPNPVNPLVVYDPFNEPSENVKLTHGDNIVYKNHNLKNNKKQELDNHENMNIDITENEDVNNESEENSKKEEEFGEKNSKEFVPMQIYTQVRNSQNVEHEPHDPLEHGRLREVLKDSKIHTVYTEEGYEDAAYDHAGHEKKAEQIQGHKEIERNKQKKDKPADRNNKDINNEQSNKVLISKPVTSLKYSLPTDSLSLASSAENIIENFNRSKLSNKKPEVFKHNKFMTTQEVKTTQITDKQDGGVQLEIKSEIKMIVQPNNSTKAHKYIKIYPKEIREFNKNDSARGFTKTDNTSVVDNMDKLENTDSSVNTTENNNYANELKKNNSGEKFNVSKENAVREASEKETSFSTPSETYTTANVITKAYKDEFHKALSIEKPKVTVKVLDDQGILKKISEQYSKIDKKVRRKKRAISSDDADINIGFIDRINHTFAEKKKSVIDFEKYPYYSRSAINVNSPLRYAENLDNIPVKKEGELSFYIHADKHECPQTPQNIDPVPEHVKYAHKNQEQINENEEQDEDDFDDDKEEGDSETTNKEEGEDEDNEDQKHPSTPKTPRIQLGDKIDCLKVRYFGENPLDNPIFKEKSAGLVIPIFKEFQQKFSKTTTDNIINPSRKNEKGNEISKTLNEINKQHEKKCVTGVKCKSFITFKEDVLKGNFSDIETANSETIRTNVKVTNPRNTAKKSPNQVTYPTSAPLLTLITTPKYTIQLTPKNIYDQIKLLDHLPEDKEESNIQTTEATTTEAVLLKRLDQVFDDKKTDDRKSNMLHNGNPKKKDVQDRKSPEAQGFRGLRPRKPPYQIFDVNRFLTTTPFSIIQPVHSTVLPKYKVISEVFYKDEIKPNEQLNVFADVLNNIKNSSNIESIPLQAASDFGEPSSVTISHLEKNNIASQEQTSFNVRVKKFQMDSSTGPNFVVPSSIHNLLTTEKHYNGRFPQSYEEYQNTEPSTSNHFANHNFNNAYNSKFNPQNTASIQKNFVSYEDTQQYDLTPAIKIGTRKVLKRRKKPTSTTTSTTFKTTTNINVPTQHTPSNHRPYVIDFIEDTKYVMGLVPPEKHSYKTIVADSEVKGTSEVSKKVYEYRKIPLNAVTEHITNKSPAPVTETIKEDPPTRAINKYLFLGLKPPINQKARPYSEFMASNVITSNIIVKRSGQSHENVNKRIKRASAKGYSEVSRNRGRQNEGLEKLAASDDDVDDYIPHRPKNYHYDEKTGRIVYHKKQQEEKDIEEEDEEYEEIKIPDTPGKYLERAEDATHPTLKKETTKPLLATATPPPAGKGLLDFVAQLKNNPSYKFYPDPTTPEPGRQLSTTEATVTINPKSTSSPEFLQILSKVRTASSYTFIDDPKNGSSKTSKNENKSTSSEPEYDDEEEEEDGGAPKKRFVRQTDLLIFNVGDYLPKIRVPISSPIPKTPTNFIKKHIVERIFPKLRYMTPFDIAKEKIREKFYNTTIYKFIQKNIQNSPGGQSPELTNIQIFDIGDYIPKVKSVSPKTTIDYSKYKTIERPRNRHNMSSIYNSEKEPDQKEERRPIYIEERKSIDKPVVSEEKVIHDMTDDIASKEVSKQKIVQIRRGNRPTTQKSTPETVDSIESRATRRTIISRRPESPSSKTTKRPVTTEVTEETELVEKIYPQNYEPAKRVYRRRPVRIRHTTERQEENEETIDRIMRRSLNSKEYDIKNEFKRESIDKERKHKNYEDETKNIYVDHDQELIEIKSDERVVNDNDKETDISEGETTKVYPQIEIHYNVYQNGATIKKAEQYLKDDDKEEGSKRKYKNKDLEVFNNDYDKTKKHGGSYKNENINKRIEEAEEENAEEGKLLFTDIKVKEDKNDNVDIINENFDKTKKHGGNYKSEEEAIKDELIEINNKPVEPQLTEGSKLIPIKRFSGLHTKKNIDTLNDRVNSDKVSKYTKENNSKKYIIKYIPINNTTTKSIREIPRLTDVVPKPEHFYTDTQLPKEVNKLNTDASKSHLDYEELEQVTKVGDVANDKDIVEKYIGFNRRTNDITRDTSNTDDVKYKDKIEDILVSTKKPLFIKDPSKRLYFYAPI